MILFTADNYEFHDDGTAIDLLKDPNRNWTNNKWCVEEHTWPGDDCFVFWVWYDGSKSLASDGIQQAYRNYVASLVVT